ncbi:MAG: hypothetical protein GC136_02555 [Alphaproteobacteria bacterium]|nr:hypothetical protein [Alphaproteobacteria bacterium]
MNNRMRQGPDFMFIGAPRAGSTWLHRNLQKHPHIWTPIIKNILVFQRPLNFQINRLRTLRHFLLGRIKPQNKNEWRWLAKYFLTPHATIEWYKGLFEHDETQRAGDITDDYLVLDEAEVKKIHAHLPDLKIIVTLRDPVDRAWSHASHYFVNNKGHDFDDVPVERLVARSMEPWLIERSRYLGLIDIWQKHFPPEQIFIAFFEEINQNPQKVLERLCAFLAIPYDSAVFGDLAEKKINKAAEQEMPLYLRKELSARLLPDLEILAGIFPEYAGQWLAKARKTLEQTCVS